jgi:hypothetical protein
MRTSSSGGIASMTLETTERRSYSRTQLRSKKLVALQGTGSQNFYSCKNVGLGGMLIEGLEPIAVGSMVRFAVRVGIDTVRGLAAIRRATPSEMGIAYTSLNMEDRAKLRTFLDSLASSESSPGPEVQSR